MPWPRAIKCPPNWIFRKKCRTLNYIYIKTKDLNYFPEPKDTKFREIIFTKSRVPKWRDMFLCRIYSVTKDRISRRELLQALSPIRTISGHRRSATDRVPCTDRVTGKELTGTRSTRSTLVSFESFLENNQINSRDLGLDDSLTAASRTIKY